MTNTKLLKIKPVVGYDSIIISSILSYLERTLSRFIPSYSHLHSLDIMNIENTFELAFCFVFDSFLNCVCSVLLLFKFGDN